MSTQTKDRPRLSWKEVWICDEDGRISFYDEQGEREASRRVSAFPTEIDL